MGYDIVRLPEEPIYIITRHDTYRDMFDQQTAIEHLLRMTTDKKGPIYIIFDFTHAPCANGANWEMRDKRFRAVVAGRCTFPAGTPTFATLDQAVTHSLSELSQVSLPR